MTRTCRYTQHRPPDLADHQIVLDLRALVTELHQALRAEQESNAWAQHKLNEARTALAEQAESFRVDVAELNAERTELADKLALADARVDMLTENLSLVLDLVDDQVAEAMS